MSKSLTELSIRSPKQYRVLTAIANGEHEGKPLKEVRQALGISESYIYSVKTRYKAEIEEIKHTLAMGRENPSSAVQAAKRFLQEKSVRAAQVLAELMESGTGENKRLAAQAILDRAGISDAASPTQPIREIMGALVTRIFYQKLPSGEEMLQLSRLAKQSPRESPSTLGAPGEEGVTSPQTPHPESQIPQLPHSESIEEADEGSLET